MWLVQKYIEMVENNLKQTRTQPGRALFLSWCLPRVPLPLSRLPYWEPPFRAEHQADHL